MYGQVEIKTTKETPDAGNLQKAADFVQAFILGKLQQRRSCLDCTPLTRLDMFEACRQSIHTGHPDFMCHCRL